MRVLLLVLSLALSGSSKPVVIWGNVPGGDAWVIAVWAQGPLREFCIYITTERR